MTRPARVVTWNGKDVPAELRDLPAGRYVVEVVDEDAPVLSPDEEAGIEAALESYSKGRVVDAKRARLQSGQAYETEDCFHLVDQATRARGGVQAVAHPEMGVRQRRLDRPAGGARILARRQRDPDRAA